MIVTRLGIVCEIFAILACGLALGFWFSWQLVLIAYTAVLFILILGLVEICVQAESARRVGIVLEQANSVRSDFTCFALLYFSLAAHS
jgi:hypothetical protein